MSELKLKTTPEQRAKWRQIAAQHRVDVLIEIDTFNDLLDDLETALAALAQAHGILDRILVHLDYVDRHGMHAEAEGIRATIRLIHE